MYPKQQRNSLLKMAPFVALFFLSYSLTAGAQPGLSFEIKKPKAYETRTLPSERTGNKKFTVPRRLYNNTVSRFNYYFNANTKLNEALAKAKSAHQDDYTKLLSFYNYDLEETAKGQMDSIIYKCTAGILLHDLRSDWVDKLYLLMGKAYLYRKDFDSASNVFQYINYAFSPKDNGYDIPIGSNASNTNGVFTIATRENRSLWKKITSFPPSRNESFIWQARTYIEQDLLTEASGLLELIRTDPNFPERLRADLHEMYAYMLYKQQSYEASADHLLQALENAQSKTEKARWEYLAGQLYQLAHKDDKAILLFERSIQHTTDPLMDVYARMNIVSMASATLDNAIQKNLDELLKMAKRDKYEMYRDVIYYAAAQLELKRKNYAAAEQLLLNSIRFNVNNPLQKQLSFLLLGDMNYPLKKYAASHRYYDSIQTVLLYDEDKNRVEERKPALKIISANQDIITREDSLQRIAQMPEAQQEEFLKKLLKQLRKEKGLKEDAAGNTVFGNTAQTQSAADDIFSSNTGAEFYFLNAAMKARGSADFKNKWGTRPNADNWRRQSALNSSLSAARTTSPTSEKNQQGNTPKEAAKELSMEGLRKDLPVTTVQLDSSNKSIIKALLGNALTFQNQLEDYPSAIEMYEELMHRFPESAEVENALFNLAYCYTKNGEPLRADSARSALKRAYPNGKLQAQLNASMANTTQKIDAVTKQYEQIYGLFLSGRFKEAEQAKEKADKEYGTNYWTPQLLYIESIYHIRQREDSTAINRLENIIGLFGKSPLAEKASTMIDVLKRRSEIENYLTNLNLDKKEEMANRGVDLNSTAPVMANINRKKDTTLNVPKEIKAPQAKNLTDISNTSTVSTAIAVKKDSVKTAVPKGELKGLELKNTITAAPVVNKNYSFNASDTQYVVVALNNVDPIFITEGRNAFSRYNQENYADQKVEVFNRRINNQYSLLMFGPFPTAGAAVTYIDRVRPLAKTRIIPWLTPDKYRFIIISNANMAILTETQDVDGYFKFMNQVLPDKF